MELVFVLSIAGLLIFVLLVIDCEFVIDTRFTECLAVSSSELVVLGETSLGFPERFGVAVNAVDGASIVRDEIMSSRKYNKAWNIHACKVPIHGKYQATTFSRHASNQSCPSRLG